MTRPRKRPLRAKRQLQASRSTSGDSVQCSFPDCNYRARWIFTVRRHEAIHSKNTEALKVFACNLCPYRSRFKYNLKVHILQAHNSEKPFVCKFKGCNFKAKLLHHLNTHKKCHDPKIRFYKCAFVKCQYYTTVKSRLDEHEMKKHGPSNEGRKSYSKRKVQIKLEDRDTKKKTRLRCVKNSSVVAKRPRGRPKGSKNKCVKDPQRTLPKIESSRPPEIFKCHSCDRHFPDRLNLKTHMDVFHMDQKRYECRFCTFTTRYWIRLQSHEFNAHGSVSPANEDPLPIPSGIGFTPEPEPELTMTTELTNEREADETEDDSDSVVVEEEIVVISSDDDEDRDYKQLRCCEFCKFSTHDHESMLIHSVVHKTLSVNLEDIRSYFVD